MGIAVANCEPSGRGFVSWPTRAFFFIALIMAFGVLLVDLVACGSPGAANITYKFAGAASGSLGAVTFTDAPFTLVMSGDTHAVTSFTSPCAVPQGVCQDFSVPATNVIFSLTTQNVTATFTSTAGLFVNQTFPTVGLQRRGNLSNDILDIQDQAFATYKLQTAIGPVGSLSVVLGQFNCTFGCVETTMGVLTVTSVANVTFVASPAQ
jgi:hypothetical protein